MLILKINSMQGVLSPAKSTAVFTDFECKEVRMRLSRIVVCCLVVLLAWGVAPGMLKAEEYRIAILQGDSDGVQAYDPLIEHLADMGIAVTLVQAPTYEAVVGMLLSREVDAVFNGPGIPGSMIVIDRLKGKWFSDGFKAGDLKVHHAMTMDRRLN